MDYLVDKIHTIAIHPLAGLVESIRNAKVSENVTQLKQLLGLINCYGTFLNQLSTTLAQLHSLLRADAEWKWTTDCDVAVKTVKEQLTGDQLVIHYDPSKPLELSCDASAYGVGAVLSRIRTTNRVQFTNVDKERAKLCPTRTGGFEHNLRCEEVSQVHIRSQI